MSVHTLRLLIPACLVLAVNAVHADSSPPIKPGLWQVHSERDVDGKAMPDMSARLQDLPPAARERMEAMMKERGVDMGADGGAMKICLSKESLDAGQWQNTQSSCKTTYSSRSDKSWKWHSVCTQPAVESDGEALFTDDKNYSVNTTMKMSMNGADRITHMKITSKWLGADCGDIKPVGAGMMRPAK